MKTSSTVVNVSSPAHDLDAALESLRRGGLVMVLDDGEAFRADLVSSAETVDGRQMADLIAYTSGLVCAAMSDARAAELELPCMPTRTAGNDPARRFSVTVDAADGVTTGISAWDRAHTLNTLAATDTRPEQLTRPGHVMVLRADPTGWGPAATAVQLCRLAGRAPVAALAPVMFADDDLDANKAHVASLAQLLQLPIVNSADVRRSAMTRGSAGTWALTVLESASNVDCVRTYGRMDGSAVPLVGVRGRCLDNEMTVDISCRCSRELAAWTSVIERHGSGAIVLVRDEHQRCLDRDRAALTPTDHMNGSLRQCLGDGEFELLPAYRE